MLDVSAAPQVIDQGDKIDIKLNLATSATPYYVFYEIIQKQAVDALKQSIATYVKANRPHHELFHAFDLGVDEIFTQVEKVRHSFQKTADDHIHLMIKQLASNVLPKPTLADSKIYAAGLRDKFSTCYYRVTDQMFPKVDRPLINFIDIVTDALEKNTQPKIGMVVSILTNLNPKFPAIRKRMNEISTIESCIKEQLALP